jgi:pimeloyl-ACP methyl ester carboxylesterase
VFVTSRMVASKFSNATIRRMNMAYQPKKTKNWFLAILAVLVVLGILVAPIKNSLADEIVSNDYLINHKSIEPFYGQYKLDPNVVIHVREVVLAGRERTAPMQGKILLFVHGYSTPGYIAFDLDHDNCSMMRYFARAGWDTFALDCEGYGLSTRPPLMDVPSAFPESKAPIHSDVAINDVERVVNFISNLRGVDKVYILGWSLGASRTAPLYTIRHQDTVAKLVLFAPGYMSLGLAEGHRQRADFFDTKAKVAPSHPSVEGWYLFGSKKEIIVPGAFDAYREALLASDPKSGELGGSFRIPLGRLVDMLRAKPQYDASKITVPTLVIRGAFDTFATQEDSKLLTKELGSQVKQYVEIPNASHNIPYENTNVQFFKAVKDFLEAKVKK